MKFYSISFFASFVLTILAPSLIIIYFALLFSCLDGCDVKKHSPTWYVTMNQSTIANLPIVNSIDKVKYYYNGELGERWELSYKSAAQLKDIQLELEEYLIRKKVQLNANVSCYNGVWDFNEETVRMRCGYKDKCIIIYLDNKESYVLIRALEMR